MDAALALGVIGTVTGLGSLAFTIYAWRVERRDRLAEVAEERATRTAQFDLEQRRFEVDMEDRKARGQAEITAAQTGFETEGDKRVYNVTATNLGPSYAKHVQAWLTDQTGDGVSDVASLGLLDSQSERPFALRVPLDTLRRSEVQKLVLWFQWWGSDKQEHSEPSNAEIQR
jgi:hypothetical protein